MISVIIPVYNGERTIKECLKSIICQSYNDIEIIIVNDGSNDETLEVCKSINDSRITLYNKNNEGANSARAFGVKKAHGEYVYFVDADDTIPKNSISLLYSHTKEKLDIIQGARSYVPLKGMRNTITGFKKPGIVDSKTFIKYLFMNGYANGGPVASLYKKTLFNDNTFKLSSQVKLGEDLYMNLCLATKAKRIGLFNDVVYNYKENENSVTHKYKFESLSPIIELNKNIEKLLIRANLKDDYIYSYYSMAIQNIVSAIFHNKSLANDSYCKELSQDSLTYMRTYKDKFLCKSLMHPQFMKVLFYMNRIRKSIRC